ncbi:hypothetical protein T440DRAFT_508959 [Plenodomus tracheiphilus IPT5]|uniref:Uncharacterized protein n=1 Tax=Plenodomus tracheiphilus IPT5 TaxID=1408161 RepID=A0A6A7B0Z5_9PLEO|nr:hypothetical protein T440DRAFT_508959 [Plenodomus tracheiphilus IPT5]
MSPNTPTLRRSPRSAELSGHQQVTDSNSHSQHRLLRSMSKGSQLNSVSSPSKQIMDSQSRAGSQVATRRSSCAGSRHSSSFGGLVSLPGAGTSALLGDDYDFNIDPALLASLPELDGTFMDEFSAPEAFESNGVDATHVPATNVNATNAQKTNSPNQFFQQGLQLDAGFNLVPVSSHHDHQAQFNTTPTGLQWDANLGLEPQYSNLYTDSFGPSAGLSAIPRGAYFRPQQSAGYQQPAYPPPPSYAYGIQQPYYAQPMPVVQQTGYIPYGYPPAQPPQQAQYGFGDLHPSRYPSYEEVKAPRQPNRKRDRSLSSSEEDAPIIKRPRGTHPEVSPKSKAHPHPSRSDDSRRHSVVSDSSSLGRPVKVAPVRAGQKPKKHEDKTWVRINNTTKGETTRTARINAFADIGTKYKHHPLPIGNWVSSSGFKFEYTHHFEMDEFKKQSMSARQIHEYITQYPGDNLRIWIQITPGDSARRYASEPHSRCIFEQCPNRKWCGKATIEVGSYRVAFDEKHKKYGKGICDPFDCVGYAHLYCMERFLDFAGVCETADVKVDDRSGLNKEPKAIAPFTFLNNKHVYDKPMALKFVKAAQAGALHRTPEFRDYPNHCDYTRGQPKPHDKTLVAALYETNLANRTRSQIKQFVNRKILPGVFPIHRGDQEMVNIDKMVAALPLYQSNVEAGIHKASEMSGYYDQFFPQVNQRINDCLALRTKLKREDDEHGAPTRGGSKKRRIIAVEASDHELDYSQHNRNDDDFEEVEMYPFRQPTSGPRSSPRKKQRIDYTLDPIVSQEQDPIYSQIPQLLPQYTAHPAPQPQQAPTTRNTNINAGPTSNTTRNNSCSQFFAENPDVQPFDFSTLDSMSPGAGPVTEDAISRIVDLSRRKSSTLSNGPFASIMKISSVTNPGHSQGFTSSPRSPLATRSSARTASFNAQPVSSSKEFALDDPPSLVTEPRRVVFGGRRSKRIASKSVGSPSSPLSLPSLDFNKVASGRVGKGRA